MKSFKEFITERCWPGYKPAPGKKAYDKGSCVKEDYEQDDGPLTQDQLDQIKEATYQGKKVSLNKPMAGDVKKSKVYVDPDGDGKAKKVEFGDPNMSIKKDQPARRKSFRARHGCDDPSVAKPKDKARYWSCRAW